MAANQPLFHQIAYEIEKQILSGALLEEQQVPSTNELAAFYRINPATVAKGVGLLVDQGVLYKKRGVGMFVSPGARQLLQEERTRKFPGDHLAPLVAEAKSLGIDLPQLLSQVKEAYLEQSAPKRPKRPKRPQGVATETEVAS